MTITIGTKIKLLRAAFGMSQIELARHLGMAQGRLSQIESGTNATPVDDTLLENISQVFGGIDLDDPRIIQFANIAEPVSLAA